MMFVSIYVSKIRFSLGALLTPQQNGTYTKQSATLVYHL